MTAGPGQAGTPSPRVELERSLGFPLDRFQSEALDELDAGCSVLVAAPTGSGKTVVAEYAISLARRQGNKAFYTSPLKALSNQKYSDLRRRYGDDAVGLLTGDVALNGDADIIVMTTEVLRNMIYANSRALRRLGWVVLDEVHFLQDPYRGGVWEEVIIHTDRSVRLVCLSATVSNAEEVADWIQTVRGPTSAVVERRRPVVLHQRYMVGDAATDTVHLLPVIVDGRPNPEAAALGAGWLPGGGAGRAGRRRRSRLFTPGRPEVLERLGAESMLPVIFFVFSRAGCDAAVTECLDAGLSLTTDAERDAIAGIVADKVSALAEEDLDALGFGPWLRGLQAGIAAHHAGLVPPFKEAVEACFTAGLVKVVFATETLSLGVNMPARSVVIEKLTKFTGAHHEELTPGELTQLTGRAGRRGIDDVGYAVLLWSRFTSFSRLAALVSTTTYTLESSFRPTYNMAVNLVRRYTPEEAHHLLNLSFAQYRVNSAVVRTEAQLDRTLRAERESREAAGCENGCEKNAKCPGQAAHRRALRRAERLAIQAGKLERQAQRLAGSLAGQLDKVLGLLARRGYVQGWRLTDDGMRLCRVYHELDLLVVESLRRGLFDGLAPPALAGVASMFTYEARGGPAQARPPGLGPELSRRWKCIEDLAARLGAEEERAGLPPGRPPDPGFATRAQAWAAGEPLESVLEEGASSGGDFVRNVKQVADLLGQISEVAPLPATATTARVALDRLLRGVVAASSAA